MLKKILTIPIISLAVLSSCSDTASKEETTASTVENALPETQQIDNTLVVDTATDAAGNTLEMRFDNAQNTATLIFKGETIELQGQAAASGIWYKNDQYELRGKGEQVTLTKDGNTVFEN